MIVFDVPSKARHRTIPYGYMSIIICQFFVENFTSDDDHPIFDYAMPQTPLLPLRPGVAEPGHSGASSEQTRVQVESTVILFTIKF